MAKNFIKPEEIQKGDLIKVKYAYKNGFENIRKGVAHTKSGERSWRDSEGYFLTGTHTATTITVELINRPKPKVTVPNKRGAVVSYNRHAVSGKMLPRTAYRTSAGNWQVHETSSGHWLDSQSDTEFESLFNRPSPVASDLTVIFPGVGA